jgi:hypothetical protein
MELRDEMNLMWFFGFGATAFERSTMGPTLEWADLFAVFRSRQSAYRAVLDSIGRVIGYAPAWDAQPTCEGRCSAQRTVDDAVLTRYAVVSRQLMLLEQRDPSSVLAFEAYYGELGARWARTPKPGRIAALYHLTGAGRKLLAEDHVRRRAKGQPEITLSPPLRMENEIAVPARKRTERQRAALFAADRQATVLCERARGHWDDVRRAQRERAA